MSAWGDYTGGKPLVIGRNWDYGHPFPLFKKFVVFVVYKPTGSPNIVADVNYIGVTSYVPTSLNSSGIYVDWHTGRLSDPTSSKDYQHHYSYIGMILDAIFNFSSITEFENELLDRANLPPAAIILNVADANECRVYELATYDTKMRMGNGLIVSSNHFIHPSWTGLPGIPAGPRSSFSRERIANLRALGERFKGNIDAVRMMEIFDRTLYEGGPSFDEGTIFQVVTVPFKKMMWVKTPGFGHWNKIDLNPFFN